MSNVKHAMMMLAAVLAVALVALSGVPMGDEADADYGTKVEAITVNNTTIDTTQYTDTDTNLTLNGGRQTVQMPGWWFAEDSFIYIQPVAGMTGSGSSLLVDGVRYYAQVSGVPNDGTYQVGCKVTSYGASTPKYAFSFTLSVSDASPRVTVLEEDFCSIGDGYTKTITTTRSSLPSDPGTPYISGASWMSVDYRTSGQQYIMTVTGTPSTAGQYDVVVTVPTTSGSVGVPVSFEWQCTVQSLDQYTVSYRSLVPSGATIHGSTNSQSVTEGDTVSLRSNGFRTAYEGYYTDGYSFVGWKANNSGPTLSAGYTYTPTRDVTMYAQWTANSYTVTFDAMGGTSSPTSKVVTFASTYGSLPTPVYAGYEFVGWNEYAAGWGEYIRSSTVYTTDANDTLYAIWSPAILTVSLNANGGTVSPSTISVQGTYAGLPTPTPAAGYIFDGWFTAASGGTEITSSSAVSATADHTLYARYHQDTTQYSITFNANGGTGSIEPMSRMISQSITLPTTGVSKSGFNLSGWTLGSTTGTQYDAGETVVVTGAMTFYAVWTQYAVNTDATASAIAGMVGELWTYTPDISTQPWSYYIMNNASVVKNSWPEWLTIVCTSSGVTISGTPSESGQYPIDISMKLGNIDYVYGPIRWTISVAEPLPETVTVEYDISPGTGSIAMHSVDSGTAVRLSNGAGVSLSGHTLTGWTCNHTTYNLGSVIVVTSSMVLQPAWSANSFIVSYNANGGTGTMESYVAAAGDMVTLPASGFTREGQVLTGWYLESDPNSIYAKEYMASISGPTVYYAAWAMQSSLVTVTFDANGGVGGYTQQIEAGKKAVMPEAGLTMAGQILSGWNTTQTPSESSPGMPYECRASCTISSSTTFYAQWEASTGDTVLVSFRTGGSSSIASQTLQVGDTVARPADPVRAQHIFTGWRVLGGAEWTFTTPVSDSMVLEAQWAQLFECLTTPGSLTVTVEVYGDYASGNCSVSWGDGSDPSTGTTGIFTHTYASAGERTVTVTSRILDDPAVSSTQRISLTSTPTITHDVTFQPNNGQAATIRTVADGTTVSVPAQPSKDGYAFAGWFSDEGCTTLYSFSTDIVQDTTIYAGWTSLSEEFVLDEQTVMKIVIGLAIVGCIGLFFVNPRLVIPFLVVVGAGFLIWRYVL